MPRKRKEKSVAPHLEALPPLPYSEDDGGPDVEAWLCRVCPPPGQSLSSDAAQKEIGLQQQRHESLMNEKRDLYQETGNPLFAWDAYALCRKRNKPVPAWVLCYLDDIAKRLLQAKNTTFDLARTLGFTDDKKMSGGSQIWEQYTKSMIQQQAIALVVDHLRSYPSATIEDASAKAFDVLKERWSTKRGSKTLFSKEAIFDWYKKHTA